MNYLINFDTLVVDSKSEDKEILAGYILDNDLSLAVALIGNADELAIEFSLNELQSIYSNLGEKSNAFDDDEDAADAIWESLEMGNYIFPPFTKALGKKLLKQGEGEKKTPASKPTSNAPKVKKASGNFRAKDLEGMTFCLGSKEPRNGTACCIFHDYLKDNLDEATFTELAEYFIETYTPKNPDKPVDISLARAYIRDAANSFFIEEAL